MSDDDNEIDLDGLSDRDILLLLARTLPKQVHGHGKRIRSLENWRNVLFGGGSVAAAVLGAIKLKLNVSTGGH